VACGVPGIQRGIFLFTINIQKSTIFYRTKFTTVLKIYPLGFLLFGLADVKISEVWCTPVVILDAEQSSIEDMLCARDAHLFKPFGRRYCTVHPGYCHTEQTLPTSDCHTISIAPSSVRTLREDSSGDRPKVSAQLKMLIMKLNSF